MNKPKLLITFVFAFSFFIFSCNREQPKQLVVEKKMVCYQSISGSDTAWLSIDTAQKIIAGNLTFNYTGKKEIFDGKFKGIMRGDTLIGHFDFKVNNANPPFRNPVAFLKRDRKFTMGVGQFMMVMGFAEFDDRVPIDYEKGRFIFEEVTCKPSIQ